MCQLLQSANEIILCIQGYFYNDDIFNYNYAQAKVATGAYDEAEEILLAIQNEKFRGEYAYLSHLARCCEYSHLNNLCIGISISLRL